MVLLPAESGAQSEATKNSFAGIDAQIYLTDQRLPVVSVTARRLGEGIGRVPFWLEAPSAQCGENIP
jgi:hypothetical protein